MNINSEYQFDRHRNFSVEQHQSTGLSAKNTKPGMQIGVRFLKVALGIGALISLCAIGAIVFQKRPDKDLDLNLNTTLKSSLKLSCTSLAPSANEIQINTTSFSTPEPWNFGGTKIPIGLPKVNDKNNNSSITSLAITKGQLYTPLSKIVNDISRNSIKKAGQLFNNAIFPSVKNSLSRAWYFRAGISLVETPIDVAKGILSCWNLIQTPNSNIRLIKRNLFLAIAHGINANLNMWLGVIPLMKDNLKIVWWSPLRLLPSLETGKKIAKAGVIYVIFKRVALALKLE